MHPKLRGDINLAGSVTTLVLGTVALVTWIVSWPSAIVPAIFFVIGLIGLTVIFFASALLTMESAAMSSNAPPVPLWFVLVVVIIGVTSGWIAMRPLHHPTMVRVVGGIVLGFALVTSSAVALTALRARYRDGRHAPKDGYGDGAEQLAFELDSNDEVSAS